ncbi:MAG: hypothetical protein CMB99_01140 [Flavobacteriaceae bacterium]|nr:hypothetical protein [Flavobacteriaceae bacterium]
MPVNGDDSSEEIPVAELTIRWYEDEAGNTDHTLDFDSVGDTMRDGVRAVLARRLRVVADDLCLTPLYAMAMPAEREAVVFKVTVAAWEMFVNVSIVDGYPREVFVHCAKEGSTVQGFLDSFAIALSIGLRAGVPIYEYTHALKGMQFEPNGYGEMPKDGSTTEVKTTYFKSLIDAIIAVLVRRWPTPRDWEQAGG